jgi:hypothetical protein
MNLLGSQSPEELAKLLTIARWGLAIFAVLTAIAGLFTQYISDRISSLQRAEKKAAEQRLATAEERIQIAEAARRTIEETIAPRVLSEPQALKLVTLLRLLKQSEPLVVASRMMDSESFGYGRQILGVFQQAGWQAAHTELSSHSFPGVALFFHPKNAHSPAFDGVRDAFRRAGGAVLRGCLGCSPNTHSVGSCYLRDYRTQVVA